MRKIMLTFTGKVFDFDDISNNDICIEDIAHHLSLINRFTGATKTAYSVAEHCYRMSTEDLPGDPLSRLMHDAAEAFIGDLSSCWKSKLYIINRCTTFEQVKFFERDIQDRIDECLNEVTHEVKEADMIMLATEVRDLMPCGVTDLWKEWLGEAKPLTQTIIPVPADVAEWRFLTRYNGLTK